MVKREGVTSWVGGYVEGGYVGGGGGEFVGCWIRWGGTLGGGSTLAGGGGGGGWGVLQRRETLSLGPRPGKTAQNPLKSCLKNRSKITARNEQFLSGFLSKIWAVFPKKNAQILLENRSNLERDLDPGKPINKYSLQFFNSNKLVS